MDIYGLSGGIHSNQKLVNHKSIASEKSILLCYEKRDITTKSTKSVYFKDNQQSVQLCSNVSYLVFKVR